MKRILAVLISFMMIFAMIPAMAFAGDTSQLLETNAERYYKVGDDNYKLVYGTFQKWGDIEDFYYSDGYFFEDEKVYNPHLATMSLILAYAAVPQKSVGRDFQKDSYFVNDLLTTLGFEDIAINDDYKKEPTSGSYGFIIAKKPLLKAGGTPTGKTVIAITGRSNAYLREWANNLSVGASGNLAGADAATEKIMAALDTYIKTKDSNGNDLLDDIAKGNVCFWVTGQSRGGNIASLLGKKLVDTYGKPAGKENKVFAYCFAAGATGDGSDSTSRANQAAGYYNGIHNVLSAESENAIATDDPIACLPPATLGLVRYGSQDFIYAPSYKFVSELKKIDNSLYSTYSDNIDVAYLNIDLSKFADLSLLELLNFNDLLNEIYKALGVNSFEEISNKGVRATLSSLLPKSQSARSITRTEFIDDFMGYLGKWEASNRSLVANGTKLSNVPLDESLGKCFEVVIALPADKTNELKELVKSVPSSLLGNMSSITDALGTVTTLSDYVSYFINWNKNTVNDRNKKALIDWIWNLFDNAKTPNENTLKTIFTNGDYEKLKEGFPAAMNFVLSYASYDYNRSYTDDGNKLYNTGNSERMVLLSTLLANYLNDNLSIGFPHYIEHYLAKLRAVDTFYTNTKVSAAKVGGLSSIDTSDSTVSSAVEDIEAAIEAGNVVTMDESSETAIVENAEKSIDSKTDALINQTIEEALKDSTFMGSGQKDDVSVKIEPYLDIDVKAIDIADDETPVISLDISAMCNIKVVNSVTGKEKTVPTTDKKIDMSGEPVVIKIAIPEKLAIGDGLSGYKDIYVVHKNMYQYVAKVTEEPEESGKYFATFTNPHGFSEFVIGAENKEVAKIGDTSYTSLAEAVKAVKDNETIAITADCAEEVTVARKVKFKVSVEGEKTFTGSISAGSGYKNSSQTANEYDFTVSGGGYIGGGGYIFPTTPSETTTIDGVKINVNTGASITKASPVTISKDTIDKIIANKVPTLTLDFSGIKMTMDKTVLTSISSEMGATDKLVITAALLSSSSQEVKYLLSAQINGKEISSFGSGNVKVSVSAPFATYSTEVKALKVISEGKYEAVTGAFETYGRYTMSLNSFGYEYDLMTAEAANEKLEAMNQKPEDEKTSLTQEEVVEKVAAFTVTTRTENQARGIKVYVNEIEGLQELLDAGYTVVYDFYNVCQKKVPTNNQYKLTKVKDKAEGWYLNTAAKRGNKYYYKAIIKVLDAEGNVVATTTLAQGKYGCRTRK